MQFVRKNLLQALLVTRRAGSSDYTIGVGVAIALLLVSNIAVVCLGVESLHGLTERVRAVFHVNLVPLYMGTRAPFFADMIFGLTLRQHGLMHRSLGWICLVRGPHTIGTGRGHRLLDGYGEDESFALLPVQ